MIKPVNGHLLIQPLAHEAFVASQKSTYEEIGTVMEFDPSIMSFQPVPGWGESTTGPIMMPTVQIKKGDRVYFDAWLASKYPDGNGGFYWLVHWEDVRAIHHVEEEVSK